MTSLKLAIISLFVGLAVLALKSLAWWMTGSVALLSDALESTVNVATALAALIAIRVAAIPADDNHPYGHHKAEFFSAVLEGVMIITAALLILRQSYLGLMAPMALDSPLEGLGVNLVATALNAAWAFVLIRHGRRLRSPALLADGKHLLSDVVTSGGVAVGILLAMATGWWILDPILAAIVAVNVLWSGWKVMTQSLSGLMDEALPDDMLSNVHQIIQDNADGAVQAHDLRTRHAGPAIFIDFHLVMPGETTVFHSHEICDKIEHAIHDAYPDAHVTIHVEPEHKSEDQGAIPLND
ncbi:MAG: cation diffusion facilitator family transporter [Sulfitobacter sp.]